MRRFAYLSRKANRREKDLIEFSAWVRTYRRIGIPDLARKLAKQEDDAEFSFPTTRRASLIYQDGR